MHWASEERTDPVPGNDRAAMARTFGWLYFLGPVLILATLLFPGAPGRSVLGMAIPTCVALATSVLILTRFARLPVAFFWALPAFGSVLVSVIAYNAGPEAMADYAWFYMWATGTAFFFFPRWWGLTNLVEVAILFGILIAAEGPPQGELTWVMVVTTLAIAGLMLGELNARVRRASLEREELLAEVQAMAHVDELTGLPNRRAWQLRFDEELKRASRSDWLVTVAVLDLDHFKELNDEQGHQAGDRLLAEVADAWAGTLRETDFLARIGGDEFALLLPDCSAEEAAPVIDRMRAATKGTEWSVGAATTSRRPEPAASLIRRADRALLAAKAAGRQTARIAPAPRGMLPPPEDQNAERDSALQSVRATGLEPATSGVTGRAVP
ncbi:MAG: GGDEF domain-containing protein [Thermoleophilaceae bacterium]